MRSWGADETVVLLGDIHRLFSPERFRASGDRSDPGAPVSLCVGQYEWAKARCEVGIGKGQETMSTFLAFPSRRLAISSLAAGALAGSLLLTPEASAAGDSLPTPRLAKAAPCEVVDGLAHEGQSVGGNPKPPRWKFDKSPSVGSRFRRCGDSVNFYIGGYWSASYYKVSWSINCPSRTSEEKYKTPGKQVVSRVTVKAAHCTNMRGDPYNTYSVKVAACYRHNPPAADTCTRWSPEVLLTYFTYP